MTRHAQRMPNTDTSMNANTCARIAPLHESDPRSQDPVLEDLVNFVGYRPNALLTMARKPGVVPALLKLLGGAYLVWLGVQLWRAPAIQLGAAAAGGDARASALLRQGLLTAISNPKALLFYGAFLPQFIDPARDLLTQFIVMALVFVAVECLVEYLLALLAHRIRPALERLGKRFNRACGGMFVAMGLALPMTR